MSMTDRVRAELKRRKLNVDTCKECLGTSELRHYVAALRHNGEDVQSEWQTGKNRFGDQARWKEYWIPQFKLEGEAE